MEASFFLMERSFFLMKRSFFSMEVSFFFMDHSIKKMEAVERSIRFSNKRKEVSIFIYGSAHLFYGNVDKKDGMIHDFTERLMNCAEFFRF